MKLFSTATTAALLLGIGAIMHPGIASAQKPSGVCLAEAQDCNAGDQAACQEYEVGCTANNASSSLVGAAPPIKSNRKL